jgi:hypothetical protein
VSPPSLLSFLSVPPLTYLVPLSVHLAVRERISLELSRDGGLNSLELKGELDLRISDSSASKIVLNLGHSDAFNSSELQFKTHPNVDKKPFAESKRIGLRDPKRDFPVGQGLGVLKWRLATKDETVVPLSGKRLAVSSRALLSLTESR